MSLVTAAAAAGFGLVLAAACRSRAQLGGLSTIVVLVMSALGGSMMPRFLMPDFMKTVSRLTLNGWALDGFLEVFWYGDPAAGPLASLWSLRLELAVLAMLSIVFFLAARRLARRWEVV
jgi:ABC-2 type transport system permease protein